MADTKPSFLSSFTKGAVGFFKGALIGGAAGALLGGIIAAGLVTSGLWAPVAAAAAANLSVTTFGVTLGALAGAEFFGSVGAISGLATEVVRSRETASPDTQDMVNAVKVAYAQGMEVGHSMEKERSGTHFQDKVKKEREAVALNNPSQQIH